MKVTKQDWISTDYNQVETKRFVPRLRKQNMW